MSSFKVSEIDNKHMSFINKQTYLIIIMSNYYAFELCFSLQIDKDVFKMINCSTISGEIFNYS